MSDELLIKCEAPTLAGLKTGNLFSYNYESREEVTRDLRRLNRILVPKGLRLLPLQYSGKRVLLYLYRILALQKDLSQDEASRILREPQAAALLREAGYREAELEPCLWRLSLRLRRGGAFPHEIGLFLSYPPTDVRGFIDNHAANYKYLGFWKVYGDVEEARKTFASYEKCTRADSRMWRRGVSLKSLIVESM